MKAVILALTLVAACLGTAVQIYEAGLILDEDVPKGGFWQGKRTISADEASWGAAGFKFYINPVFLDPAGLRSLTLWASNSSELPSASSASLFVFKKDSSISSCTVNVTDCSSGCTIYFSLYAQCDDKSCLHSLTTDIWTRLLDASGNFIYDPATLGKRHPVLIENLTTCEFTLSKSQYQYFQFTADRAAVIMVNVFTGVSNTVNIFGSNELLEPSSSNVSWTSLSSSFPVNFAQNVTNGVAVYGTTKIGSTVTYKLCFGSDCSAAPSLTAAASLLLAALLLALM